ncbi:DUF4340 domain-containing protein [Rubritepida flocculans]|jgi:hypothetical protein|uniref:DUF4340 domain-containing protein n=1 Tax=Rubritepida flocculans TaxID=182403 RepID=UPI0004123DEB|nr:DUF4340 domain-containing protein [Rubritepida flocculans]
MISRRGLLLLGLAGTGALGAGLWFAPPGEEQGRFAPGDLAYPGLAERLGGAARIEVIRHAQRVTLLREGESWRIEELEGYPARPGRVRETLTGLTELRLIEERSSDAAAHARLGVDDPASPGSTALRLRVLDASGAPLVDLLLGRRRVRTQGAAPETVYLRRAGEARAWLAEGRLVADADPQLWVDRDIANLPAERLRRAEIRRAGEEPLVVAREAAPEAPLRLVAPENAPSPDPLALDEIGRAFEMLTFTEVRRAGPDLPGEALGEARFLYTDEVTLTAWPRLHEGQFWVVLRAEGGPEAQALEARLRGWAYQLGQWKEKAIIPRLADLMPE